MPIFTTKCFQNCSQGGAFGTWQVAGNGKLLQAFLKLQLPNLSSDSETAADIIGFPKTCFSHWTHLWTKRTERGKKLILMRETLGMYEWFPWCKIMNVRAANRAERLQTPSPKQGRHFPPAQWNLLPPPELCSQRGVLGRDRTSWSPVFPSRVVASCTTHALLEGATGGPRYFYLFRLWRQDFP